jgi:tetratricopeptide (TPR) repeat protein
MRKLLLTCGVISSLSGNVFAKQSAEWCDHKAEKIGSDLNLKGYEKKIAEWKKYKKQCSDSGRYQKWLADIYISYGLGKEALQYLEPYIYTDQFDNRDHVVLYVDTLLYFGESNKAKLLIENIISKYPAWSEGYSMKGLYYYEQDQNDKAKKYFHLALEKNSQDHNSMAWLSHIYYTQKEYDKVLYYFNNAFTKNAAATLMKVEPSLSAAAVLLKYKKYNDADKLLTDLEKVHKDIHANNAYRQIKKRLDIVFQNQ